MKYFTKEWYRTNQRTGMHLLLKASDRAAGYSEEYFQELYDQHINDHLELMERVQAVDRKALAARFEDESAEPSHLDGSPLTSKEKAFADEFRTAFIENLRKAPQFTFDPEDAKQNAHMQYQHKLKYLERCLPEEIRAKVADLRVLALRHAAREVIDEITAFSKACEETVRRAYDLFRQDFKHNFPDDMPAFYREFDLHDARILSIQRDGRDIIFNFKDHFFWRFLDAEFMLCDDPIEQCYWLMDEIYPTADGGYELHALLEEISESMEIHPREFILRCRDAQTGSCRE